MNAATPTILQIIPRLDAGGAELSAIEITQALVCAGARALVVSEGGRMAGRIADVGGTLIPFAAGTKNPGRMARNALTLVRLIEREGVSLVHARSRAPAWSALLAARRTQRPFVTTYHGAYAEAGSLKRLYNSVMARGDVVIANSAYTRDLIRARYGTPAARIRVIYRGLDGGVFDPECVAADRVERLRASWGVAAGERVILLAARLTAWKGQSILVGAAEQLNRAGRLGDAVIILAGDAQGRDGYVDALVEQIARAGLSLRVRIVGHVDDMPAAFLAAHVTAVPSTEPEAFGRAAAEAQAMGCPVIATRIGAPQETVIAEPAASDDRITGWLVPPGDVDALAAKLLVALDLTESERRLIGLRARAHVLSRFTLEAMKEQTLASYDELLGSHLAERFRATTTGSGSRVGGAIA